MSGSGEEVIMATQARVVLICLADSASRSVVARSVQQMSMHCIEAEDGDDALFQANLYQPDAIVIDLRMGGLDGIEFCNRLRHNKAQAAIPIVVVSDSHDELVRAAVLASGAVRFVPKPLDGQDMAACLRSLSDRQAEPPPEAAVGPLLLAASISRELRAACRTVINNLGRASESGMDRAGFCSERVGQYAAAIAAVLGLDDEYVELLRRAAALRDIGKLGVPARLLCKAEPLSKEESDLLRAHTSIGHVMLQHEPPSPVMQMAAVIALNHHEWWDGNGYPNGLVAEAIPLEARITAVADSFHELTGGGFKQPSPLLELAISVIARQRGSRFDPAVVDAFVKALPAIVEAMPHVAGEIRGRSDQAGARRAQNDPAIDHF